MLIYTCMQLHIAILCTLIDMKRIIYSIIASQYLIAISYIKFEMHFIHNQLQVLMQDVSNDCVVIAI